MTQTIKSLSVPHLDEALEPYRKAGETPRPSTGWAKTIRQALGMTKDQLSSRIGITPSGISTLERNEAKGSVTLESLERLARGMDCHVVYAIVPNAGMTLDEIIRRQAESVARKQLGRVSHTMRLEEQGLNSAQEKRQLGRFVEALLSGSRRKLWR